MNARRIKARSIEWEPLAAAELHHGAHLPPCNETPNTWPQPTSRQKLSIILATQEPTIHGSSSGKYGGMEIS